MKRSNPYAIRLYFLSDSLIFPNIDQVLLPIGEAITVSIHEIEVIKSESITEYQGEYFEAIVQEETDLVENLLGTAFIICQTYISSVCSHVVALHNRYQKEYPGSGLSTTSSEKSSIMSYGNVQVGHNGFSEVQVIYALANYFKHRSEWIGDWSKLPTKNRSRHTAEIVSSIGATRGSTGNLRTGAKSLGNPSYAKVEVFADILRKWLGNIHDGYEEELRLKNLI